MNERLPPHLDSMRRAASDAIAFVNGMSLEEFTGDKKTQAAAAMCLAIVGESANKLAAGLRSSSPLIPTGRGIKFVA